VRAVAIRRHIANRVAAPDLARDVLAVLQQPASRLGQEARATRRVCELLQDSRVRIAIVGVEEAERIDGDVRLSGPCENGVELCLVRVVAAVAHHYEYL